MYFPGDPLFDQDPIFNSIPDRAAASAADLAPSTSSGRSPRSALAFRFDIVLRGREATPFEDEDDD